MLKYMLLYHFGCYLEYFPCVLCDIYWGISGNSVSEGQRQNNILTAAQRNLLHKTVWQALHHDLALSTDALGTGTATVECIQHQSDVSRHFVQYLHPSTTCHDDGATLYMLTFGW